VTVKRRSEKVNHPGNWPGWENSEKAASNHSRETENMWQIVLSVSLQIACGSPGTKRNYKHTCAPRRKKKTIVDLANNALKLFNIFIYIYRTAVCDWSFDERADATSTPNR